MPTRRRRIGEAAAASAALVATTAVLTNTREHVNLLSAVLIYLLLTVLVALAADLTVAIVTAVLATGLLNYYFTPPLHRFSVNERANVLALFVFVFVAVVVAVLVDRAEHRRREAARATADAETLADVAGSVLRGESALNEFLGRLRQTLELDAVSLLEHSADGWQAAAAAGPDAPLRPEEADEVVAVDPAVVLALRGPQLDDADRRVAQAFAYQAASALRSLHLEVEAEKARPLLELDKTRTALLAAVSHDLRAPLAGAKAAVSSLRSPSVEFSARDRDELLATADESLDRLTKVVANLLDMSRMQAGAMVVHSEDLDLDGVIALTLDSLGPLGDQVAVDVPDSLPTAHADAGLLERVLGNLLENAVRMSPSQRPPTITAGARDGHVQIKVIDHGPGLGEVERHRMFMPFQRLGDTSNTTGVGLGLAVARGFTEAMQGTLAPESTPGGGLTMVVTLPAGENGAVKVLVVDDEPQIVRALTINLRARGHQVFTAKGGTEALVVASRNPPDVVLLDLGLPDLDGVDVIEGLRGWSTAPIIVLSGRVGGSDKVAALDAGADDYVTKPFGMEELLARIRAVSRRAAADAGASQPNVRVGGNTVDVAAHRVLRGDGTEVRLTKTEWQLLDRLVRHAGQLVTQKQLLTEVWGPGYTEEAGYLRFHFRQLRRKLEADPARPRHLITEPGIGYRFEE